MNILVTGATGFLGTILCARLNALNHIVVQLNSKNCDLTRADSLHSFNNQKYDQIFHLAAWTQAGDFCLYHPGEQWIINQQINTNVLAWWQHHQSQAKLISIGTSCSYDPNLELKEDNYLVGTPIESLYTYAMTKRMLYIGQLALHRQYGLRSVTAVPSTLYGPGYHLDSRQMHFIFDLMRKIIRGKLFSEQVVLWGDGNQKRELVYIEDFVSILLRITSAHENALVNIGAGREFTIRHFAQIICDKLGYNFDDIVFDTNRYVGAKSKCLVVDELKKMIPDYTLTPLETGIGTTLDWFMKEMEKLGPSRK